MMVDILLHLTDHSH